MAAESTPTVAVEIRRTSAEANLGMGWTRALENMGRRLPLLEVNLFAAAVQLHARTGGKLSEVMAQLAENMRENLSRCAAKCGLWRPTANSPARS